MEGRQKHNRLKAPKPPSSTIQWGRALDMSESRVSQIHSELPIRLREHLWKRRDELQAVG